MRGFILWTACVLFWRTRKNDSYGVQASVDPSSSSNSYNNHYDSSCSSGGSSSSNDFIYSQTYQLNLSSPPVSFPGNTADIQKDETFFVSHSKNTESSFDTWIQKFNSKLEKLNAVDFIHDDDDDTDQDDDDDNDDDGHSSMLSIISLRRKQPSTQLSSSSFSSRVITTRIRSSDGQLSNRHRRKRHAKVRPSAPSAFLTCSNNHVPKRPNESIFCVGRGGSSDRSIIHPHTWISQWIDAAYQSQVGRNLIVSAIVTLVFEAMIGHILEFLKIVMQTSSSSNSSTDITYLQVIRTITAEKGILGLWDGFCPWGVVQAVCKGAVFGLAHATALQTLKPLAEQKYIPMALALTLAGGIGGGFQGYILSPTLLLKTRVMTNPVFREKMSAWRTTLLSFTIGYDVVKKEGLGALMKGANVFATKRVFDWASRYYFADLFEDLFTHLRNGSTLSVAEKSAASLLGGVFSTMVTLPLDVLVAKTQDAKKAGIAVSPLKLFQDELHEKGWKGIRNAYMRGFEARLLHVCLTTVVIKTGTPIAYEAIFGSK